MSEPTEGYVIRWPRSNGYEYVGIKAAPATDLQEAIVMSLHEASIVLRGGGYEHAEIVRVRRVQGEEQWVDATSEQLMTLAVDISRCDPPLTRKQEYAIRQQCRIPGEPRWEVVEE